MSELDVAAVERAGFKIVRKAALDYVDPKVAEDYLRWGFKAPEQVKAEAAFAVERMGLQPGASVLDIGCGNGVAAVRLAEQGFRVTALDISPVFVQTGRTLAQQSGVAAGAISWVVADFLAWGGQLHDAAILLDPAIEVASEAFIGKLAESVAPGGWFFLRYKQGTTGKTNWPWRDWRCEAEGSVIVLEDHTLDRVAGANRDMWIRIDFANREVVIEEGGGRVVLFSRFVEMMSGAGFGLVGAWGDVKGSPVNENSRIYALFRRAGG